MMTNGLKVYLLLCSLFSVLFVTSNLVFKKFTAIWLLGHEVQFSVGLFFYPIVFLISDLVTEFYGKKYAKQMLYYSAICSLVVLILVQVSTYAPATSWSLIDDQTFYLVFGSYGGSVFISIFASVFGQVIDIYCFSYIKYKTNGRYLWLRNNVSTILGQAMDTILVVFLLAFLGVMDDGIVYDVIYSSFIFKLLITIASTPFYYIGYYIIRCYR